MLAAVAAGGVGGLAGCISAPAEEPEDSGSESTPTETQTPEPQQLQPPKTPQVDRIAADPTDVPSPIERSEPTRHEITIQTEEITAEIEPGVTFNFMTYEGQVPGPMYRVRVGDTVHLTFEVPEDTNGEVHNIDFHAVYGPGGGANHTSVEPGDSAATIEFTAQYPGVHIYHCAVPMMDYHISSGMFGAILVEPEDGLRPVDRELYFGQHEIYTTGDPGDEGHHRFDFDAMMAEEPTYVVLNGEAYAFTEDRYGPISIEQGETVRVYWANGGPNLLSAWHPIGNVWSRLYRDGSLLSPPDRYVETAPVAPGTVAAGEMETPVPGPIKLVDHALSRVVNRGMLGVLSVEGEPNEDIYDDDP